MRRLTRLTNAFSKEVGEPLGGVLLAFRLLQFLPHSPDLARHARHGIGIDGSRLGFGGTTEVDKGVPQSVGLGERYSKLQSSCHHSRWVPAISSGVKCGLIGVYHEPHTQAMPPNWFWETLSKEWKVIADCPIIFFSALAILVFITYLVVRHFYRDRIEALNHMLNLYKERFGSLVNGAQGRAQLPKVPEIPEIAKAVSTSAHESIKVQKAAMSTQPIATLSESPSISARVYSRELRLQNPEGMELHIYPSGDKYVSKLLNGPSSRIRSFQVVFISYRSLLPSLKWCGTIPFTGDAGPTTTLTNPGCFTPELDFAIPQQDGLRLGNAVASVLEWPDGHPNPIQRWHVTTRIIWEVLESKNPLSARKSWTVEILLRWNTEDRNLEFMEYADTTSPEASL